ncbi:unnamed protein product [Rotaria sp. Silwood2]|nr:unnamed protein product [Rotaria sp. Silwood2]
MILSDEKQRALYDRVGEQGMIESTDADPFNSETLFDRDRDYFIRTLGIYISERQIQELYDEQCFKKNILDPYKIKIDFYETIRIYYNHFANNTLQTSIHDILKSVFVSIE